MKTFRLRILEADRPFYEGECESLIFPTVDGQYGVQARHSNLISAVVPGTIRFRIPGGEEQIAAVSVGMVKIEDGDVLMLVDSAERPEEIDVNRAEKAAAHAKEAILQNKDPRDFRLAQAELARAINRINVGAKAGRR